MAFGKRSGCWAHGIKLSNYSPAIKILGKEDTTYYLCRENVQKSSIPKRCPELCQYVACPRRIFRNPRSRSCLAPIYQDGANPISAYLRRQGSGTLPPPYQPGTNALDLQKVGPSELGRPRRPVLPEAGRNLTLAEQDGA